MVDDTITVTCSVNQAGVNSILASLGGISCTPEGGEQDPIPTDTVITFGAKLEIF